MDDKLIEHYKNILNPWNKVVRDDDLQKVAAVLEVRQVKEMKDFLEFLLEFAVQSQEKIMNLQEQIEELKNGGGDEQYG